MRRVLYAIAALCVLYGCGDENDPPTSGTGASSSSSVSSASSGGAGGSGTGGAGGAGGMAGTGGSAADSWNNYAKGFFESYCVECHIAGDPEGRDYTLYSEIVEEAATIRCGVTPTALPDCTGFPPPARFPVGDGPKPDTAERQRLVDWIDAGLPE